MLFTTVGTRHACFPPRWAGIVRMWAPPHTDPREGISPYRFRFFRACRRLLSAYFAARFARVPPSGLTRIFARGIPYARPGGHTCTSTIPASIISWTVILNPFRSSMVGSLAHLSPLVNP